MRRRDIRRFRAAADFRAPARARRRGAVDYRNGGAAGFANALRFFGKARARVVSAVVAGERRGREIGAGDYERDGNRRSDCGAQKRGHIGFDAAAGGGEKNGGAAGFGVSGESVGGVVGGRAARRRRRIWKRSKRFRFWATKKPKSTARFRPCPPTPRPKSPPASARRWLCSPNKSDKIRLRRNER